MRPCTRNVDHGSGSSPLRAQALQLAASYESQSSWMASRRNAMTCKSGFRRKPRRCAPTSWENRATELQHFLPCATPRPQLRIEDLAPSCSATSVQCLARIGRRRGDSDSSESHCTLHSTLMLRRCYASAVSSSLLAERVVEGLMRTCPARSNTCLHLCNPMETSDLG